MDSDSLRQIAVACRDDYKSGFLTQMQMCSTYGITRWQAIKVIGAIDMGLLDDEIATERAIGQLEKNVNRDRVELETEGNVLVIGDTHIPFCHKDYLDFCLSVKDKYDCDTVIHIGDEVDNHALSYHENDPDGFSAGHEANMAIRELRAWYKAFPEVTVIVGNHGALPFRKAYTAGIPRRMMKTYEEMWDAPDGWVWTQSARLNESVMFEHGLGSSGKNAALNRSLDNRCSTVIGHVHSYGGVQYTQNNDGVIYGMNVGCGVDIRAYAMAYGKHYPRKPTLGCGVVLGGGSEAHFIPMG